MIMIAFSFLTDNVHEHGIEWITTMKAGSHSSLFLVQGKHSQEQHPQQAHSFFTDTLQQEESTEQVVEMDASVWQAWSTFDEDVVCGSCDGAVDIEMSRCEREWCASGGVSRSCGGFM